MPVKPYSLMDKATGRVWGITLAEVHRQCRVYGLPVEGTVYQLQHGLHVETPHARLFRTPNTGDFAHA